jgi:hypothetical protein
MNDNKKTYTFKQLAVDVLEKAPAPLTTEEIWLEGHRLSLDVRLRSVGKTPIATLYSDLHKATQDAETSEFVRVGSRPRRYWLRSRDAPPIVPKNEATTKPQMAAKTVTLAERDLHPLLAWYADIRMGGLLVRTIYHEKSKKRAFGEWVHPDLVGVLFPKRALDNDLTLRLAQALSAPLCKIYSFEIKVRVDFSNLREAFFQAVSNSSWAHEAYLVASELDDSPEFVEELERLSHAFGVGVIRLFTMDPNSSSIVIPARARTELDWTTIDKLAEMNADVAAFLKNVTDDMQTDIHPKEYDSVPDDPVKYLDEARQRAKT